MSHSVGGFRLCDVFSKISPAWIGIAAAVVLSVALAPSRAAAQSPCPSPPPVTIPPPNLSAPAATLIPDDACIPSTATVPQAFAYFDDYSWRAFIALVWPAQSGTRGMPDTSQPLTATGGPRVFETFKADWETFQPNGTPPSAFNSYTSFWTSNPSQSPCPSAQPGDFILAPITKFGNVGLAGFGNLVAVLVSQNGRFVRYLAAYNQTEFNQILSQQLFLRANLSNSLTFQTGALDVKSAWIDMTGIKNPDHYYTRPAWLVDPISGQCSASPVTVGLVGLHIVQKTPTRPQWIWSTFEQVDNVPPPGYVPPTPPNPPSQTFTFNDGTATPMPSSIPANYIWSTAKTATTPPAPINIQRLTPINASTAATNATWQGALQAQGSVWQYYQLVMTQWPTPSSTPSNSGAPGFSIPGTTADQPQPVTAFANPALETWDQVSPRVITGCMNCHTLTKKNDFLWSLQLNAYPLPTNLAAARHSPALSGLRSLLERQPRQTR